MLRTAKFSPCRTWRYSLSRIWSSKLPPVLFIGLNPSTADETLDDPTIRRCMRFAKSWGYGGIHMANIFAFRATKPEDMKAAVDPVGPDNDLVIAELVKGCPLAIAAWGVHGAFGDRWRIVAAMIPELHCLGLTKDGHPKHPLYLKADTKPERWIK